MPLLSPHNLTPFKHRTLWFNLAFALLIMVAIVSLMPAPAIPVGSDKLHHFLTYFVLALIYCVLIERHTVVFWAAFGLIVYGVVIELLQGMTGYRYMEAMDILANCVGVVTGTMLRFTAVPKWGRSLESRLF